MTGRCVRSRSTGTADRSSVLRVALSNVRMPRSQRITWPFPCARMYSAAASHSSIVLDGPLVRLVDKDLSDAITSWHRRGAWLIFALAGLHVGAVAFYLVAFKENLVRPMLTGAKVLHPRFVPAEIAGTAGRAMALLALCGVVVWYVVTRLGR